MTSNSLHVSFYLWLICFFSVPQVFAQQLFEVSYRFEQDTIFIEGGQTFANKLLVKNHTDQPIRLTGFAENTEALNGLISLPDTVFLEANETRSLPLKYIANRTSIKSNVQAFTIGLISLTDDVRIQPAQSFFTKIRESRGLAIHSEQSEYYLDPASNQVQFMVRISNRGLVPQTFRLLLSEIPEGLEFTGETMSTTLGAGGQVMLPFTARSQLRSKEVDFQVTIQATDEQGQSLAVNRIRIVSIGSVKRFGSSNDPFNDAYNNSFALRYLSMNQNSSVYQAQGNGQLSLGESRSLDYRLNFDYYQDLKGINIYDTYLDYQTKDWGVKVGNIYANLDHNLSGRGVKASYKIGEDQTISVYAVENNYLLFSHQNYMLPGARILAADYRFKSKTNSEGHLTYLHSNHEYRGVTSNQVSGKTFLMASENQLLEIEGGYSLESVYEGGQKHGIAGGLNYRYRFENYQFSTNNYYSSPYFTGLRRGLIQSNSRISRTLDGGKNISARISFMDSKPKYQEGERGYRFQNHNRVQHYELGYGQMLGQFSLNIRPYLMIQGLKNQGFGFQDNFDRNWRSNSLRTAVDFSFFSASHRFSINTDYGYTYKNTADRPAPPFHSLRMNGSYTNRYFGFTGYLQLNPYYLSDLYSTPQDARYQMYSFGPNTQFSAFRNKLSVQLSTQYNYYGFSRTKNLSANGNARWKLRGNWDLTADVYFSMMQSRTPYQFQQNDIYIRNSFNNRQIRIGVEKKFATLSPSKGYKLQLLYFEDHNNNGIKEREEPTVEGVLVKIGKEAAITDARGRVRFQNMKEGSYTVLIQNSQGWVSKGATTVAMTKDQSLEVPLVKTKILKGKVLAVEQKYQESKPTLSGIRINAIDQFGNQYRTHSDDQGNYTLYLASGSYTVFIETEGMPFSIENASNEIELSEDGEVGGLDFHYKDERRKIEVQRF